MKFGDKYIKILGKTLKKINYIKEFSLKNNRITDNSSDKLMHIIGNKAVKLDLSYNKITDLGSPLSPSIPLSSPPPHPH